MHERPYAEKKAAGLATGGLSLELVKGSAESIPFESSSFDAVLCTLTLCSVECPEQALREVQRVLKSGGAFIFVEHVCASKAPATRAAQTVFNPLHGLFADGCHLYRDTADLIRNVGTQFESIDIDTFIADMGMGYYGALMSHQISGIAIKR